MLSTASKNSLHSLLNPRSIAVVGASRDRTKIGYITLHNLIAGGYEGVLYAVNPHTKSILKVKCYPSVLDLPKVPDLVIVSVPVSSALDVLRECIQKGIKSIVMFTAGFKELGTGGAKLERELQQLAYQNSINLLGPNCLGFVNTRLNLNATFSRFEAKRGNLNFISQSGALSSSLFDYAAHTGIGMNQFITLGNKSVISENEILKHWIETGELNEGDPVGMYLESIHNGQEFVQLLSIITKKNPVFLLKPGKSVEAKKSMQSHTGSLAGDDYVLDAALDKAGVVRCDNLGEVFTLCKAFSWARPVLGPNVAIVSNAGGLGVVSSDLISAHGLKMAPLSDETKSALHRYLPPAASIINPIDVLGDALSDRYASALEVLKSENSISSVLVILTPQVMTQVEKTAKTVIDFASSCNLPVICTFVGSMQVEKGKTILDKHKIPSFEQPEDAIFAIAKLYQAYMHTQTTRHITTDTIAASSTLDELLFELDQMNPPHQEVNTVQDALHFVNKFSWPVVLKISDETILHKTEMNGIYLNIVDEGVLQKAYTQLSSIKQEHPGSKIVIQKQVQGVEVLIGFKHDPSFGPILLFGAGGIYTEIMEDRNILLLPATKEEVQKTIENSKIYKILSGARGKVFAMDKLVSLVNKLANALPTISDISDFEINPVLVEENDIWPVDIKVIKK